jgi:hypothetical protein
MHECGKPVGIVQLIKDLFEGRRGRMTLYDASNDFHDKVVNLFNVICETLEIEKVAAWLNSLLVRK